MRVGVCVAGLLFQAALFGSGTEVDAVVRLVETQVDSIEMWVMDRVYLIPERIQVGRKGVYVTNGVDRVKLPSFSIDGVGVFLKCSREEAHERCDEAWDALIDKISPVMDEDSYHPDFVPLGVYEWHNGERRLKKFGGRYSERIQDS